MRRLALLAVLGVLVAGCGGEETVSPTGEVEGTLPQAKAGNTANGKKLFAAQGCDGCHTYKAAGSTAKVGPDLDQSLKGKDDAYIKQSIVAPDEVVASGFQPGIMPKTYAQLPEQDVADLVAFLKPATG